jgi:hypothetical protein
MYEETPEVQINLNEKENKRIVRQAIAETLIRLHGDKAHLVALQELMDAKNEQGWRDILVLIDELTGEKK